MRSPRASISSLASGFKPNSDTPHESRLDTRFDNSSGLASKKAKSAVAPAGPLIGFAIQMPTLNASRVALARRLGKAPGAVEFVLSLAPLGDFSLHRNPIAKPSRVIGHRRDVDLHQEWCPAFAIIQNLKTSRWPFRQMAIPQDSSEAACGFLRSCPAPETNTAIGREFRST